MKKMNDLRKRFLFETEDVSGMKEYTHFILVVSLPTGSTELIINTDAIAKKIEYVREAYDDEFKLKTNPNVGIKGYLLV